MKLLLHTCCGICSLSYLDLVKEHQVTLFFYNPNIHPLEEYKRRRETAQRLAQMLGFGFLEGEYNPKAWFKAGQGLEAEPENGLRCLVCFELRLKETALRAKKERFEAFSTSLNLSPYKDTEFINQRGKELAGQFSLNYLDFNLDRAKRFELSRKAHHLAQPLGLYHQKYCGCVYSRSVNPNQKSR